MKNRILLLFNFSLLFFTCFSQPYPVILKVIDQSKGQVSSGGGHEDNIFTWLDEALRELNPSKSPTEWWWPMYNDADYVNYTNGELIKTNDAWEWTLSLQVNPGSYEWNPHAKWNTYTGIQDWNPIREGIYSYEGDTEKGDLVFTVAADGTVSGSTELIIPANSNTDKFPVTLQVIDYSKGELSDAPGTWAQDANIVVWVTDELNDSPYWFYGFFDTTVQNWDGQAGNVVSFSNGKLIKEDDKWIWQATFQAAPGSYEWNPMSILHGWTSLNGYGGASWAGENLTFTVNPSGEVSGDYFVNLGYGETANVTFQVDMTGVTVSPQGVRITGSFNNWDYPGNCPQLAGPDANGIYSVTLPLIQREQPYEYKFVNGQEWEGAEVVFGDCAYRSNRILIVEEETVVVPPVRMGMCGTEPTGQIKIACIGDSNTEATGVSDAWVNSWPMQLRTYLNSDYTTENFGVSGATLMRFDNEWGAWTNNVSNMYEYNKMYNADIILVALGSNDSKNGYWGQRDFTADYIELINEFKQFTSNPQVYMIIPIRAFDNGYDINNDNIVNGIIPAINELSRTQMLPVIDWYSITSSLTKEEYMPDGVHANEVTSRMMAEKAAAILLTPKPVIRTQGQKSSVTYAEYRWYKDGALIEGAAGETYTATQAGTYHVAVKLSATENDVIISEAYTLASDGSVELFIGEETTGIGTGEENDKVVLTYSAGNILIENAAGSVVSLYNMTGTLVKTVPVKTQKEFVNMQEFSEGVYICNVSKDQVNKVIKIVK